MSEPRHYLDELKYRQTGEDPKLNGFAYAEVPDWQLRQWQHELDNRREAMANAGIRRGPRKALEGE